MTDNLVTVYVRDGRVGRDPALVTEEGGELLMTLERRVPLDMDEHLELPDGTTVQVIGLHEQFNSEGWKQTASVGNL